MQNQVRLTSRFPVVGLMTGFFAGAAIAAASAQQPNLPQQSDSRAKKAWTEILALPRQRLNFEPTRQDITVGKVIVSLFCSSPKRVRVNGVHPDPAWLETHFTEAGEIVVDKRLNSSRDEVWFSVSLKRVATNQFELNPLKIEFDTGDEAALLCVSVKAWFNEVSNQYDSMLYKNLDDRYALVSYCTKPPAEHPVKSRFGQNRAATTDEFKKVLSKPLLIELNERPLRDEWRPAPNEH